MQRATLVIAAVTLAAFVASPALAQNSKFSAMIDKVNIEVSDDNTAPGGDSDSRSRMTTVKLPGNKALLIGVSSQIAIDTSTKVVGKKGGGGSATATGDVSVAVAVVPTGTAEVDITPANYAEPGEITFAMRSQDLSAVLGGVLVDCTVNLDGTFTSDDCNFTNEEIALLLETTAAHHYNFIWEAPATGEYDVWLLVDADAEGVTSDTAPQDDGTANEASADVVVGPTVVSIEEVRPAKGGVVEFN